MAFNRNKSSFDKLAGVRQRFGRLVQDIAAGLEALHRQQFDEPWKPAKPRPMYGEW